VSRAELSRGPGRFIEEADLRDPEDNIFLLLLLVGSLAFAWILWPLYGAVVWAIIAAVAFTPLYRRLSRSMGRRPSLAALVTLAIIVVVVILPLTLITTALLKEAYGVHARIQSGELNLTRDFERVFDALPAWATNLLDRFELTTLDAVQQRVSASLLKASQFIAAQAINIGQSTLDFIVSLFVMLYLLFFLLRDGDTLSARIKAAIPLHPEQRRALFDTFTTVIRATVKGNLVVALTQGALGGLIFWFLGVYASLFWGVLMAFLSLLPAVGPALVWFPVAVYFLVTGATWQGIVLIAYGVVIIGLVDNVLRPMLVGKDTKIPDYVVLISTLGGLAVFGFSGVVIGPVIAAMCMAAWEIFAASRPGTQVGTAGH
jgi:predicted PurR-regulated permease PerM